MKRIFLAVLLLLVPLVANAEEKVVDEELHGKVNKGYNVSKKWQSEINIFGGDYLGDETHNSYDAGIKYYLNFNKYLALGASYTYSPIYTDWDSTFGKSVVNRNQHLIDGEIMFTNPAAFRSGKSVIECDLFGYLGMGTIWINRHFEVMGLVGGGIKVYPGVKWFAIRFDVVNYIHPTPNPAGDTINADLAMNGGVSFMFPPAKMVEDTKN